MAVNTRRFADERGDRVAIVDEFDSFTYVDSNARVNQAIHGLRNLGLGKGETVGLLSGNRSEFVTAWSATQHTELRVVPINWHFSAEEVAYVLQDSGATALLADAEYADLAVASADIAGVQTKVAWGGTVDGFVDFEEMLAAESADEPPDQTSGVFMLYTSGTTGHPKGVMSSTATFGQDPAEPQANVESFLELLGLADRTGVTLANAPLYHGGPLGFSLAPSTVGAMLVMRRKWDAEETLRMIDDHGVSTLYAVPTHFARLLALPEETRSSFDGSSLHTVFHTAAPCPPVVKQRMIDWWGPVIYELYGASEGGFAMSTLVSSEEWLDRPGTVGKPTAISEVFITDENGNVLPAGEVGTVYLRSLLGIDFEYHEAPEKTSDAHHPDGGYTAGDVGYLDDDGYLFLSDRKIDMIISGGVNIYPAEIEACLIEHDTVADVAVIGVPNDEYGEEVKALVQVAEGNAETDKTANELKRHCREHLAGYMVPKTIDFMELPRTPTGKLSKKKLRAPYWEGTGRSI
jgi:long-chain acyl-CoA synthetase